MPLVGAAVGWSASEEAPTEAAARPLNSLDPSVGNL